VTKVAIALGSNLGDREANLEFGLSALPGFITNLRQSSWHDTTPLGVSLDQPRYLNGVVTGETNQYYRDFARAMHQIGYDGYISYELCHQLPVVNGETVGIEFAHKNAQLAAEFMREIIKSEYRNKPGTRATPELVAAA